MSVEFNEENFNKQRFNSEKTPKIAGFLISKGIAKDLKSANKIQIILAIVFFLLALFFTFK